jgi:hypothetical protein
MWESDCKQGGNVSSPFCAGDRGGSGMEIVYRSMKKNCGLRIVDCGLKGHRRKVDADCGMNKDSFQSLVSG